MRKRYIFYALFLVIVGIIAVGVWQKQAEQAATNPTDNIEKYELNKEVTSLVVHHQKGNVIVKEWDKQEIKVDQINSETKKPADSQELDVKQSTDKIMLESKNQAESDTFDLTIWIPSQISSVDVAVEKGNIKGEELSAKKFVRFVTQLGNIVSTYTSLDPKSKNILITKTGTILAKVPQGTSVKLPTGKAILNGVEESRTGVEFNVMANSGSTIFQSENFKVETILGDTLLTPEQMKKDTDYIIGLLTSKHPFFIQASEEKTKAKIEGIYKVIQQPLAAEEFYLLLHTLFAHTKDGHTMLGSYSKDYISFPSVMWTKEGIIVTEKNGKFEKGDLILQVNGKSETQILELLREVVPAEHDGYVKMSIRDFLTPGMFLRKLGFVNQNHEVPFLIDRSNKEVEVTLPLVPSTTSGEDYTDILFKDVVLPPYHAKIDTDQNWGIITLNASIYNEEYHSFVVSFLDEMDSKGIKNLIIDNRQNTGGTTQVADPFLKELKQRSFTKDNVFLLTSTKTFSAGTDLTVLLKSGNLATIVGTETGNIVGYLGNVESFSLPVTQWGGGIPTTRNGVTGGFDPSKPLQPDYYIDLTRKDIMAGMDPWFEKIRELVK
jgi:hypothetical protein